MAVKQHARAPRILGGDNRDFAQHADRAQRDVFKVSNGGANDIERSHEPRPPSGVPTRLRAMSQNRKYNWHGDGSVCGGRRRGKPEH